MKAAESWHVISSCQSLHSDIELKKIKSHGIRGLEKVTKQKGKKSEYEKALSAYSQAMKVFRRKDYQKAAGVFKEFLEKHVTEKELIDRAQIIYLFVKPR